MIAGVATAVLVAAVFSAEPADDALSPGVVYLNFDGAELRYVPDGPEDPYEGITRFSECEGTWPAYGDPERRAEILARVQEHFAAYDVVITDELPCRRPYVMVVVGPFVGCGPGLGYADPECDRRLGEGIVYAKFSGDDDHLDTQQVGVIAHEIGHAFGLGHVDAHEDLMHWTIGTGEGMKFVDACLPMGGPPWGGGGVCALTGGCPVLDPSRQNSHLGLMSRLGPSQGTTAEDLCATATASCACTTDLEGRVPLWLVLAVLLGLRRRHRGHRGCRGGAALALCCSTACARETEPADDVGGPAGDLADVVCHWLFECGCQTRHADETACRAYFGRALELEHASAEQAGLTYDGACAQRFVERLESQACLGWHGVVTEDSCRDGCQVFHGGGPVGAACGWPSAYHDCEQGLFCARDRNAGADICVDPCLGEGETCGGVELDPAPDCDSEAGLRCRGFDETGIGTCQPMPGEGDPCPEGSCAEGLHCPWSDGEDAVCQREPGFGDPCPEGICIRGMYCADHDAQDPVCAALKPDGAACDDSLECLSNECIEGSCVTLEPVVCERFGWRNLREPLRAGLHGVRSVYVSSWADR